jgi:hypothetical protein
MKLSRISKTSADFCNKMIEFSWIYVVDLPHEF